MRTLWRLGISPNIYDFSDTLKDKKLHALKKNQQILGREIHTYMDSDKMEDFFTKKNSISMQRVVDNLSTSRLEPVNEEMNKGPLETMEKKIEELKW